MPKRYSIAQARANLPAIVDQVEEGQEIEITRRGKPVAVVVSGREIAKLRGKSNRFAQAYKRFLQRYSLRQIGIEKKLFASKRYDKPGRKVEL